MKRIPCLAFQVLILACLSARSQSPSSTQNYIMETVVKHQGHKTTGSLSGLPVDSANRNIRYVDGLGRPLQTVQWQGSPGKKDIVSYNVYDALGREAVKYLPYAEQSGSDASYRTAAATNQANFYGSGSWDANIVKTPYPYSRTVFEASPLDRVLEQGAPGAVWQPYSGSISGSGHTVRMDQGTNGTGEVALWKVNGTGAATSASYAKGTLSKTVTKDENWTSGKAGTVAEFRDMLGRIILKRTWSSSSDSLSTFYVYDDYGNLRYVVPPAVSATSFAEASDSNFTNFIYAYHYDGRKRVVEKKVPGKGWEHTVYNKLDQVVLTQDSVMRANGQWLFTKYDALGRVVINGRLNSSSPRATWQGSIDAQSYLWEERDNANASGTSIGYTNVSLPTSGISAYFSVSYYDGYGFYGNPFSPTVTASSRTNGLATGSMVNLMGSGSMLRTVVYYDDEGRAIETVADNHLGGTDRTVNTYNFAGELTASTRTHVANSTTTTIANTYTYDHVGRKLTTRENINSQGDVWLNKLEYNGIGQLKQKNLHSTNGSTFLQNTRYSYNERGWMKGGTSAEFSMKLGYDTLSNPQYNGNISTQLWGSGSSFPNRFDYTYDKLNRLTNGTTGLGISMGEVLTYDVMGNIATMNRDGVGTATYSYSGNQLTGISGGGLTTGSYAYDGNGNATTDGRLGATFVYNHLNLPTGITKTGLNLAYTYDATGKKLQKVNGTTSTTTDYVDGIQYTNGSIDFIQTEEGRALNSGGTYSYQYDLKDHLGNVRYSFDIYSGAVRKLQADDYYAFGLRHSVTGGANNYLYNGKELQNELGQYDYSARLYDPVIGRFNTIDPMADNSRRFSPYTYAANNPLRFIDPDGMDFDETNDKKARQLQADIAKRRNANSTKIGQLSEKIEANKAKAMKLIAGLALGISDKNSAKELKSTGKELSNDMKTVDNLQVENAYLAKSDNDIETLRNDHGHDYSFGSPMGTDGHNYVTGADNSRAVSIIANDDGLYIHEIRHVGQSLEAGGLKFFEGRLRNSGKTFGRSIGNEVDAYKTQYAFAHTFPGSASDINRITPEAVYYIRDDSGKFIYQPK